MRRARVWLTHKEGEKGWLRQLGSVKKETWGSICSQTSGWAVGWHKRARGTYVCFTQAHNKRAPAHKYASHSPASTRYCLSRDVAPPCPWTGKIAQIAKIIVARLVLWSSSHACDLHNFIHPVFDQLSICSFLCWLWWQGIIYPVDSRKQGWGDLTDLEKGCNTLSATTVRARGQLFPRDELLRSMTKVADKSVLHARL